MNNDNLSDSEYDLTSDYQTTEEENVTVRNIKKYDDNLLNNNLIDYSNLKCASCQEKPKSNNFNFLLMVLSIIIIAIIYCFFKKKF